MKVNQTYIAIAKKQTFEVNVGDRYGDVEVSGIDVNDHATFITIKDSDGKETTYGSKIFYNKFKEKWWDIYSLWDGKTIETDGIKKRLLLI